MHTYTWIKNFMKNTYYKKSIYDIWGGTKNSSFNSISYEHLKNLIEKERERELSPTGSLL